MTLHDTKCHCVSLYITVCHCMYACVYVRMYVGLYMPLYTYSYAWRCMTLHNIIRHSKTLYMSLYMYVIVCLYVCRHTYVGVEDFVWHCLPSVHPYKSMVVIHSFVQIISVAPTSSPLILRSAPDTARILSRGFTPKRHRQLQWVEDLPEVPTWRL